MKGDLQVRVRHEACRNWGGKSPLRTPGQETENRVLSLLRQRSRLSVDRGDIGHKKLKPYQSRNEICGG